MCPATSRRPRSSRGSPRWAPGSACTSWPRGSRPPPSSSSPSGRGAATARAITSRGRCPPRSSRPGWPRRAGPRPWRSRGCASPHPCGGGDTMAGERAHGVISVLIAAAAARTRACLTRRLEAAAGIAVLGEAATGERALALAQELEPDVVLLDEARRGSALAATPHLLRSLKLAGANVLRLDRFECEQDVLRAWRHGLSGLVDRGVTPEELV